MQLTLSHALSLKTFLSRRYASLDPPFRKLKRATSILPGLGMEVAASGSGAGADCCRSGRVSCRFGRGVEQISQEVKEGWLRKVQAGQAISVTEGVGAGDSVDDIAAAGSSSACVDDAVDVERETSCDLRDNGAGDAVLVTGVDIDRAVAYPTPHNPHLAPTVPFSPRVPLTKPQTPHVQLVSASFCSSGNGVVGDGPSDNVVLGEDRMNPL